MDMVVGIIIVVVVVVGIVVVMVKEKINIGIVRVIIHIRTTHLTTRCGIKITKAKGVQKAIKKYEDGYYRCGMQRHWSRTCRTPKYLVDLYQASIKGKGKEKEIETNFADHDDPLDITHLEVADFLVDSDSYLDPLNNESV